MSALAFTALFWASLVLTGWPVARLLRLPIPALLAAPVLGLAVMALAVTTAYRFGVLAHLTVAAVSLVGLIATPVVLVWTRPGRPTAGGLAAVAILLVVVGLAAAPGWTGSEQFRVFQGNDQDQLNYLAFASAYREHGFEALRRLTPEVAQTNSYLTGAAKMLAGRPAVSLLLAGFARLAGGLTSDVSYAYLAALQGVLAFAATGLAAAIAGRLSIGTALIGAAAALGFFGQYVLDINAWSQLAALPLIVLAMALLLGETLPAVALGLLLGALLTLYPELLAPLGPLGLALLAGRGRTLATRTELGRLALAVLVGIGLYLPQAADGVGYLLRQYTESSGAGEGWWRQFEAYLFGRDLDYFAPLPDSVTTLDLLYGAVSLPIDFVAGMLGLNAILPGPDLPLAIRVAMKLALAGGMGVLVVLAMRRMSANQRRLGLGLAAGGATTIIIALVSGLWAAGKLWATLGPVVFVWLAMPALRQGQSRLGRWPAMAYVALALGLGLFRPVAAMAPDGVHYHYPYPALPVPKQALDWQLSAHRAEFLACKGLVLDIASPTLERYLEVELTELGRPWSSLRPITTDFANPGSGDLGVQPPVPGADCLVTTDLASGRPELRQIWLGTDARMRAFKASTMPALDLVTAPLAYPGFHDAEDYQGSKLRWSNGNLRIIVPASVQARELLVDLWPVRLPQTRMTLTLAGNTVFDAVLPDGDWSGRFPLPDTQGAPLSIEIVSPPFQPEGDPRQLGLAFRHLELRR